MRCSIIDATKYFYFPGPYHEAQTSRGTKEIEEEVINPLILMQLQLTNTCICSVRIRTSTSSVKYQTKLHIIKNTVMKQNKGPHGFLKPEHMNTTNKTTISPSKAFRVNMVCGKAMSTSHRHPNAATLA